MKSDDIHAGDALILTLRWTLLRPADSAYFASVSLLDRQGIVVAESADQIGGPDESTISVRAGDFVTEVHRLGLPLDALGDYQLLVSVRAAPDGPPIAVAAWPEKLSAELRRPSGVIVDSVQARAPEAS
jgi:hypothetical protein